MPLPRQNEDISYEKQNTQVGYIKDGSFDYHTIAKRNDKNFDEKTTWIGIRKRFFYGILVAKNDFSSGNMEWTIPADSARTVVRSTANMKLTVPAAAESAIPFSMYYGPSDYHILKKYDMRFEKLINLGRGCTHLCGPSTNS